MDGSAIEGGQSETLKYLGQLMSESHASCRDDYGEFGSLDMRPNVCESNQSLHDHRSTQQLMAFSLAFSHFVSPVQSARPPA